MPLPWVMRQTWLDLLFAHWPVPPERIRALVPSALEVDLCDGRAWVSVTPFEIAGSRPRGRPAAGDGLFEGADAGADLRAPA